MSRISVDVSSARIPVLQVGYQGENEVTDVLFDISSWIAEFGEGVAQLRVKRPGNSEEESYVLSLTITDGIALWTVSETDTFNKGNGKVQLSYLVGNIVKKAVIYPYKVGKSIVGADNPVDPFDSWIERSKAWAIGETLYGDAVPETDETYQNNAKYYAEQADILGSAQVVLATEKADAASQSEANAAASEAAVNGVSTQLTTRMSAIETEQSVQSARMDTFTSLPAGSTSGNAELADIRVGAYGTTYDTAGNAVRGQISELKSDLGGFKNSIVTELNTENFFDNQIGYETGCILSDGTISTEGAYGLYYSTSVAFPLKAGTWSIYTTNKSGTIDTQFKTIYFVDGSDGSVIFDTQKNEKITFTATHDGLIRISVQKKSDEQTWTGLMLVQGEYTYNFIPYKKYTIIKNSVCLNETNPFEFSDIIPSLPKLPSLLNGFNHYHSVNYFDYRIGIEKGFLKSNGELDLDGVYGSVYYTSNPIRLSAGTWTLYCTSKKSGIVEPNNMAIHFVDDFNETVIYNAPGSSVEKITFTALHNGILRFSYSDTSTGYEKHIMLVQGEYIVEYAPYDEALIIKDDIRINEHDMIDIGTLPYQNVLFGKKYIAAGDSYTAWSDAKYIGGEYDGKNVTYDREIRLRNHMSGENRGISGSSMALTKESFSDKDYRDGQAFSNTRYLEIPEDTDILTIAFGINDMVMCDLGQLGDKENTTFYGAWHKVLSYYAQNRPEMRVGIICFQRSDNDFYRAVKEIAKYYGIPLLDFFGSEDTPMYVDGKAYPVDETIKSVHKAYWCGHAHGEEVKESFRGKEYMTIVGDETPGHPGYRAHIDESTIIEDFLRRL